ncbi:MAG: M15 family metallopeptidase [Actinomycetota bacterium]|nr:M15 family metallopeptidase [Actinomycetota bacterium]
MIILQAKQWQRLSKIASRFFEAERELFTHFLTLVVLVGLIGSAAYMDARLQPKAAHASAVKTAAQPAPATPTANAQPAPAPQPPAPAGPPALTQNTQNLNPELLRRFDAFRSFIWQKYGVVLEIRSGYRSTAEQAQLFATLPAGRANPPGRSNHEKGEAIDYTNYTPEYNQYLGQFGLHAPYAGKEDWHVERVEMPPAS